MVVTPPSRSMSHTLPTKGIGQGPPSSACQPILHHHEQTKKKKKKEAQYGEEECLRLGRLLCRSEGGACAAQPVFKKDGAND